MVRRGLLVAAGQEAHNAIGMGIEGSDEDVEVVGIVGHAGLGSEARGKPLAGPGLEETVNHRRGLPDGIVVPSVENRRGRRREWR
jgi:hypothetical protein